MKDNDMKDKTLRYQEILMALVESVGVPHFFYIHNSAERKAACEATLAPWRERLKFCKDNKYLSTAAVIRERMRHLRCYGRKEDPLLDYRYGKGDGNIFATINLEVKIVGETMTFNLKGKWKKVPDSSPDQTQDSTS